MASGSVHVDVKMSPDFEKIIREEPGVGEAVTRRASDISRNANALGSGFRTGFYHPGHKSPAVGGTAPEYGYEQAEKSNRYGYVSTVHPLNYSAMKDTYENNTLLKAKG